VVAVSFDGQQLVRRELELPTRKILTASARLGKAIDCSCLSGRVRVAADEEGGPLKGRIAERAAERHQRRNRLGADDGGIELELHFEIDARLLADDFRNPPSVVDRDDARFLLEQGLDELALIATARPFAGWLCAASAGARAISASRLHSAPAQPPGIDLNHNDQRR
jgi:hypothetical protein